MLETEEPLDTADPPDGQGGGGETEPEPDSNLDPLAVAPRAADVPDGQSGGGG